MSDSFEEPCSSSSHRFKIRKIKDIESALGKIDDHNLNSIFTKQFCETFDSLRLPTIESDWLAQNSEKGQTYAEFLQLSRTLHTKSSSDRKSIYFAVLGQVDNAIFDIDSLTDYTQRFFQMQVKIINPFVNVEWNKKDNRWTCSMNLTNGKARTFHLRTRYDQQSEHSQICVTAILNLMKKVVPYDARCFITLTMLDLYGDETDLFIAGLANGNCRVAAFSLYRYDPHVAFGESDWFDCKLKTSPQSDQSSVMRRNLLLLRSCRLVSHEICHIFGIAHCVFYDCLLNGSGNLEEDFSQPLLECPIDLRKLYALLKFNIYRRYEELSEFFNNHSFINEMKIVETKLNAIKQFTNLDSADDISKMQSQDSSRITQTIKRKCTSDSLPRKRAPRTKLSVPEDKTVLEINNMKQD